MAASATLHQLDKHRRSQAASINVSMMRCYTPPAGVLPTSKHGLPHAGISQIKASRLPAIRCISDSKMAVIDVEPGVPSSNATPSSTQWPASNLPPEQASTSDLKPQVDPLGAPLPGSETQQQQDQADSRRKAPMLPKAAVPVKRNAANRGFFPTVSPQELLEVVFGEPKSMPEFLAGLESINTDGGPVVYQPQVARDPEMQDPSTLPLLLYLPGIDGTGLAAYRQFPGLVQGFDLRALYMPPSDRSSFEEIVTAAQTQLEAELAGGDPLRPVYLLGESFGALVAIALAQRCQAIDRVVLCNPATSFNDSVWPLAGPLLTSLPSQAYNALPIFLSPILTNPINVALGSQPGGLSPTGLSSSSPLDLLSATAWGLVDLLPELGALRAVLPPETLAHRLSLLQQGSQFANANLSKVQQRVLLLVGEKDLVIPSSTEGPRLKRQLPRANLRVIEGRSHAMLQEAGVDLMSIMKEEGFYVSRRQLTSPPTVQSSTAKPSVPLSGATFGKALPIELPTPKEVQRALDDGGLTLLRRLVSPVFFSTDPETGRLMQGLDGLPFGQPGKPVLLVGNHQLLAADMPIMIAELLQKKNVLVRGLAHPLAVEGMASNRSDPTAASRQPAVPGLQFLQSNNNSNESTNNPFGSFLKTFGAVTVNGKNMHSLLSRGETVLLYPGGAREAYKYRDETYQLIWPDKPEFVRMAARFGATIVPFGAVGAEDGINQVLDGREILNLPIIGDYIRSQQPKIPQVRQGVHEGDKNFDTFVAPLVSLKAPARFYYVFGKPIETTPDMASNRAACEKLYREVYDSCEANINYLLRKRQEDPYKDLLRRLAYEAPSGGKKEAPTFTP